MENRIPLPTDNIFKFYAFFGLLLVIFGFGSIIYITKSTNELVFETAVEYDTLEAVSVRTTSQETSFKILKIKLEIAQKDKESFLMILNFIIAIGIALLGYGFFKWHTEIQPRQDEISRLTLKKLKRELGEDESA